MSERVTAEERALRALKWRRDRFGRLRDNDPKRAHILRVTNAITAAEEAERERWVSFPCPFCHEPGAPPYKVHECPYCGGTQHLTKQCSSICSEERRKTEAAIGQAKAREVVEWFLSLDLADLPEWLNRCWYATCNHSTRGECIDAVMKEMGGE